MDRVLALILAGGRGDRLSIISEQRAKPAVPFGGKYRIIDFPLSNSVHSGILKIGVLTQYRPRSLSQHIGIGQPWDLDRRDAGVVLLPPFRARHESDWYRGTADAVYQNLDWIEEQRSDQVLILAGDHIYRMAYDEMIAFHRYSEADVTVAVTEVPIEEASRFGLLSIDATGQVTDFEEKPARPRYNLASMGVYVFNRDILAERLLQDARRRTSHDFGKDIIPGMVGRDKVFAYGFRGYWRDVGTVDSYWQANLDLLDDEPEFDLYDPDAVLRTKSAERPPARIGPRAQVSRSLISNGCVVNGSVHHSVLSPGVVVQEGAIVEDSIIFDDTVLGEDAIVQRCILDKEVWVGPSAYLGFGDDYIPNHHEPDYLNTGISLVGKRARVPAGVRIGRNCKINPGVRESDFDRDFIASGETVACGGLITPNWQQAVG
jgi:glucose-1-phosphate adenylyltransferase